MIFHLHHIYFLRISLRKPLIKGKLNARKVKMTSFTESFETITTGITKAFRDSCKNWMAKEIQKVIKRASRQYGQLLIGFSATTVQFTRLSVMKNGFYNGPKSRNSMWIIFLTIRKYFKPLLWVPSTTLNKTIHNLYTTAF